MPVLETAAALASIVGAGASSISAMKDTGDAMYHTRTVARRGNVEVTTDKWCHTHGDAVAKVEKDGSVWAASRTGGTAYASYSSSSKRK